jgi:hypothetical protein
MFREKKVVKGHVQYVFPARVAVSEINKQEDGRLYISEFAA